MDRQLRAVSPSSAVQRRSIVRHTKVLSVLRNCREKRTLGAEASTSAIAWAARSRFRRSLQTKVATDPPP